jgi:hypothetical protein
MLSRNKIWPLNTKISRIRMILMANKISQKRLGQIVNMSAGTVNNFIRRIENNEDLETKFMRRNLELIGRALKIKPDKLIGCITIKL